MKVYFNIPDIIGIVTKILTVISVLYPFLIIIVILFLNLDSNYDFVP